MSKSKFIVSAIAMAALFSFMPVAQAKVFSIPSEDAIATVNAPDAWEPTETDNGIEMTSEDGNIYISVDGVKADNLAGAVADTVKLLADQGLVIDQASKKVADSEDHGMKIHDFHFDAKDEDGPTNFGITVIESNVPNKYVMLTFWGSDEAIKANDKILQDMSHSIQLTKQ